MSAKALTMMDTTKTTTATKTAAKSRLTRIHAQPSVIQQAAAFWSGMAGDQKSSYTAAAAAMANSLAPAMPPRADAYGTFITLSAANIAANLPLQATASPYAPALPLPAMQLVASYVNNRLTLTLLQRALRPPRRSQRGHAHACRSQRLQKRQFQETWRAANPQRPH